MCSLAGVGLGLRSVHIEQILTELPEIDWLEILLDNHAANGGLIPRQLAKICKHYPISFHCVGMSLAGVDPLDMRYLAMVKRMRQQYSPLRISDHLCFTQHAGSYFNDLLPIPYTEAGLQHVSDRVSRVQDYLNTSILIENVSTYLQFQHSEMNEAEFIKRLVEKTGCDILLDINNVYVNEFNHGASAKQHIAEMPMHKVKEIHLAGYEDKTDYLIDAHNNRISHQVWNLFGYYLQSAEAAPVLIEWDNDIPELSVLLEEAEKAKTMLQNHFQVAECSVSC